MNIHYYRYTDTFILFITATATTPPLYTCIQDQGHRQVKNVGWTRMASALELHQTFPHDVSLDWHKNSGI